MAKGRLEDSIDGARWIWAAHNRRGPSVSSFFHTSRFLTLKCRVQVLNVQISLLLKSIVDALNVNVDIMASSTARLLAGSLIIGCTSSSFSYPPLTCSYETYQRHIDGAARIGSTLSSELLNAIFAKVGQATIRKVARETFEHLLNLDLRFYLSQQTGGLTRAINRGTKYVRVFCASYGLADKELR